MTKVKFHFKLEAKGQLQNVKFFPEDSQISISINTDDKKTWENEDFELMINNPFQYELVVFGVTGTKWEAELKIIDENSEKEFLSWSGITGDSAGNVSRRTKPEKNIE